MTDPGVLVEKSWEEGWYFLYIHSSQKLPMGTNRGQGTKRRGLGTQSWCAYIGEGQGREFFYPSHNYILFSLLPELEGYLFNILMDLGLAKNLYITLQYESYLTVSSTHIKVFWKYYIVIIVIIISN